MSNTQLELDEAFQNGFNSGIDLYLGNFIKMKYIQFPGNHLA